MAVLDFLAGGTDDQYWPPNGHFVGVTRTRYVHFYPFGLAAKMAKKHVFFGSKTQNMRANGDFGISDFWGALAFTPRLMYSRYMPLLALLEIPDVAGKTSKKVVLVGKMTRGFGKVFFKSVVHNKIRH
jgi:hypothetical protein